MPRLTALAESAKMLADADCAYAVDTKLKLLLQSLGIFIAIWFPGQFTVFIVLNYITQLCKVICFVEARGGLYNPPPARS